MTMFGRVISALPVVGALVLAGCGGSDTAPMQNQQAGQGVAVGEPNGSGQVGVPVAAEFIKMAQESSCAGVRNRLFVIDGKQVFWDRAGNCPDNAFAQTLFGANPQMVMCSYSQTIAGPKTFCADDKSRELFDTIQKNLDKADLGLAGHKVEPLSFLPAAGTAIGFETIAKDMRSGVTVAKQVVVKDAAGFAQLWAEHAKGVAPAPAMPQVDFSHQMVLAVFAGQQPNACHTIAITRVGSTGGKMVVEYDERDLATFAACAQAFTYPMQMVVVERNDAPVEFVAAKAAPLAFKTLDQTTRSGISEARDVVVKDLESWSALWAQHAGADAPLPVVNFSKQMVIGVFLGTQANGCYSTNISSVSQAGNKLSVLHVDTVPGMGVMCTMALTTPAHLVVVDRSDSDVVFATEVAPVK